MDCKKVRLVDAQSNKIYLDDLGIVSSNNSTGPIKIECVIRCSEFRGGYNLFSDVFVKDEDKFRNVTKEDLELIFDMQLYVNKSLINGGQPTLIHISEIHLSAIGKRIVANQDDKKPFYELLHTLCYELPTGYNYNKIESYEIKEGMLICYAKSASAPFGVVRPQSLQQNGTYSTYRIEKLYHQPNRQQLLASARNIVTDELVELSYSDIIYKVPYENYDKADEFAIFDDEIEEIALQPFWEDGYKGIKGNLYWQPLEEASQYIISVYKYNPSYKGIRKLYLLEKLMVERNKCWITIDNLFGDNYILRLEAENRSGEIIGRTRGIPVKYPGKQSQVQYWKD